MKANTADAPYVVQKGALTHWQFSLTYAAVDQFLVMAHEQLAASRLPYADRKEALQVYVLRIALSVGKQKQSYLSFSLHFDVHLCSTLLQVSFSLANGKLVTDCWHQ